MIRLLLKEKSLFANLWLAYTVELQWLELWWLIHLGWLELSSWSLHVILGKIHPRWVELPLARINFHGPKPVWAIENSTVHISSDCNMEEFKFLEKYGQE